MSEEQTFTTIIAIDNALLTFPCVNRQGADHRILHSPPALHPQRRFRSPRRTHRHYDHGV
ncbi:hypothetical protein C9415_09875 [Kluyvera sp. Nf5]|nr:hypothetical protein C9415_09875 [Kluyvera sp. Nf5]